MNPHNTETKYIKINAEAVLSPSKELCLTLNTFISEEVKKPKELFLKGIKILQCAWCNKNLDNYNLRYQFQDKYHCSLKCFRKTRELVFDLFNSEGVY